MAKLKGHLPLQGTLQNITFVETPEGIIARTKSSLTRKRLTEDKRFERVREQNSELGRITAGVSLLRKALRQTVFLEPDSACFNRLTSRLSRVLKTDQTGRRGQRRITAGRLELLKGFEFNAGSALGQRLLLPPTLSFDRSSGLLQAGWPSLQPGCVVDAPKEATHVRFVLAATLIDFDNKLFDKGHDHGPDLTLNDLPHPQQQLQVQLPAGSSLPLIVAVGLEFLDLVNGVYCPLDRGRQNAMGIVEVMG